MLYQSSWFSKAKRTGSVRLFLGGCYMPSHNVGNQTRKRVQFTLPPNGKGRAPVRLNHTQHLAQTNSDVREEHNPQSAQCCIEHIVSDMGVNQPCIGGIQ